MACPEKHGDTPQSISIGIPIKKVPPELETQDGTKQKTVIEIDGKHFRMPSEYSQVDRTLVRIQNNLNLIALLRDQNAQLKEQLKEEVAA